MCVRELNFRLLLRGLRADSMFAYWSKSSRVSVRSSAFSAAWSGVERFATLWGIRGEFGTTYISKPAASPRFSKLWFIFNGLIPRSCSTLPLLSFHLAAA